MCLVIECSSFKSIDASAKTVNPIMDELPASHFMDPAVCRDFRVTSFLPQIYSIYHTGHISVISGISNILQLFLLFKLVQNSMIAAKNCWHNGVLQVLSKGKGNCIYLTS